MIIDFRLRPPHPAIQKGRVPGLNRVQSYCDRLWVDPAPSVLQQSMTLLEAEMREAGISVGVTNASYTPIYPGTVTNDDIAQVAREYPGKFIGLGSISLEWSPEAIRDETRRCVVELAMPGMSIDPYLWSPPVYPDCDALRPLYETCIELDVPVAMSLSGSSPPDFTYCSPGRVDAVAARYPELKIVVAHACWPHVLEMCAVVFRRRNVWISPDMYMLAPGANEYVQAANTFARERFLFATCYPSLPLKPVVDLHYGLPLREGVLDKIFSTNALSLLRLS